MDLALRLQGFLEELEKPKWLERIAVRIGVRTVFVPTAEIEWIEAEGNYSRLHTEKKAYLLRDTLGKLEARLNPKRFLRIHRSTIVNLDRISALEALPAGDYVVILRNGAKLTVSRGYRERLRETLGAP